jgi:tyrosine-specific transport protein
VSSSFWSAVFLLTGSTIGAGIFGIPYVTAKSGYLVGLFWLIILSALALVTNLAYAVVIKKLEARKDMQIVGLSHTLLGGWGKVSALIIVMIGHWGAILAYIIGSGKFTALLVGKPHLEGWFSIIIFSLIALGIWFRMRFVAALDGWLTLGKFVVVALIAVAGAKMISLTNIFHVPVDLSYGQFFMPIGVIFGALSGYAVIPEMFQLTKSHDRRGGIFYKTVLVGTIIPIILYILFQFIVVSISGEKTSDEAILGLVPYLDIGIIKLGAAFGVMSMVSAFLTLAFVVKDTFLIDFKLPAFRAWFLAIFPPFLFYMAGVNNFIMVLDVTGFWLGIMSIVLILTMYFKVKRRISA